MESLGRYYQQQPGTDRFGHQEDAYFLGERVRGAVLDMLRSEYFASALRGYMRDSGCSTRRKALSHFGAMQTLLKLEILDGLTTEHLGDVIEAMLAPSQLDNIYWESHGKFAWNFSKLTPLHRSYYLNEGDFKLNYLYIESFGSCRRCHETSGF